MPRPSLVDRRVWTNLVQVVAGLLGAIVGAVYGSSVHPLHPWIGAGAGAWVGFLLFVLISGALLVFAPAAQTHRKVDVDQYLRLHHGAMRAFRVYIAATCVSLFVVFALRLWFDARTLLGCGLLIYFVAHAWVVICHARLEDLACPHCGDKFGFHATDASEHRCLNCGRSFLEPASGSPTSDRT